MNTQKTLLALCALCLFAPRFACAQGSLTPPGAPAPTMRTLDQLEPRMPIQSVPFTITQPGSYVVVNNISGAESGITVQASNVTVDLNGFELTGKPFVFGHGIIVVGGCDNVTIRNGTVRSWGGDGVHASEAVHVALDDLCAEACGGHGIAMSSGSIGTVTSQGNGGAGLFVSRPVPGIGIVVKKNPSHAAARLLNNSGGGLVLQGACDIEFSGRIAGNTGNGIAWSSQNPDEAARLCLTDCDVSNNTGSGLHISEASAVRVVCSARGSSFLDNGGDGIALLLTHADAGLQLDLREGSASGNGGCGMNVKEGGCKDNKNVIIDFRFEVNAADGGCKQDIAASPSYFTRVISRGNGGRGLALEGGTWTLEQCTVADNVSHGIESVMRTGGGHVTLIKFAECDVARNGGKGVSLAPDAGGGSYKVAMQDMHVHDNGGDGLSYIGTCDASVEDTSVSGNAGSGLAWASSGGGTAGTPGAAQRVRLQLRSLRSFNNLASGLHIAETGGVDVDCDFASCDFDRNGADGVTLQLTNTDSRLSIVHRAGGACDNTGHGLNIAAGRRSNQGFFDIALSRNAGSGCNKIDAGADPGTMERVVAQNNGLHGLDLTGGTWSLAGCTVSDNTGNGIAYASRHVKTGHVIIMKMNDCDAERNGGDGLYVHTVEDDASYKVAMQDMHLRSNAGSGLRLSCDNAQCSVELDALDSSASGNAACGVKLIVPVAMDKGLRFRVKGGDCDDNAQGGIFVDDAAVVRSGVLIGCVLRNNGAAGFRAPGGTLRLESCVASGNVGDGYLITRPPQAGTLYQFSLDCDGCDAVGNGGSGLVVAGFDASSRAPVSIVGGQVCDNAASGIDLSTALGARGRVHAVHFGNNLVHGLHSAASSLDVCDNQFTGNAHSGLHVLSGAHRVARNVCTDNAVGVYLAATGSSVLQNTFGGGSGGTLQVPIEDLTGASDIAPLQNAATGTNPLGNQTF